MAFQKRLSGGTPAMKSNNLLRERRPCSLCCSDSQQNHGNKPPLWKASVSEVLRAFCEDTSGHGFAHIWTHWRSLLGIVWLVITITMLVFLVSAVINLFKDFTAREISSKVTTKHSLEEGLQLPSVALCNRGIFSRYKLEGKPKVVWTCLEFDCFVV
ncbi:uncharacterized protein LOC125040251 [Penaeus chinensis]|uniref:uncharacterized protein LOC125040251 n=1 Tax=Penaeus chinensis TaxID=139456 RepID=UPI001FB7AF79|nr:uncharacterized protein LOC125040251 [Penaeus chinensis]